jgi:hypothetical protein
VTVREGRRGLIQAGDLIVDADGDTVGMFSSFGCLFYHIYIYIYIYVYIQYIYV